MSGERRRKIENEIEHRESGISGETGIAKRARPSWTRALKTHAPAGREPGKAHKQRGKSHL